ncbi:predicted protein [Naegleria gruberi]|uniref:Predicted protein n=1 Tax=Naegleria gruberi TaxID=5762 RepID=D2VRG3_NAEGR|nr:uncharacterized protein NAEGRDRAFT_71575 [Naegleria gruberi]EFC40668.1 predicted protein [Naegleria gruberi]|eukprot:XP_002673412.1 predicted protein [Naegleria gruberi strain NEG-M]
MNNNTTTPQHQQLTPQTIQLPNYNNTNNNNTASMQAQNNNLSSSNQQPMQQQPLTVTNTSSSVIVTETAEEKTPKKRKTPSKPSSATKKPKVDLSKKLKSLEKDELIQLITTLPEKFPSKYDTLQQDILTICPDADVDGAIQDLEQLRRNVEKAFPRAKYGTNRDDYAFKRVKPTLTSFKKSVTEKTTEVKNGQNWSVMCRYLNKLMEVVDDLPVFDSTKNNSIRDALFKHCATNYTAMLKARDCNLTSEEIESIDSTLEEYDKKKDEVFSTAVEKLNARKSK